MTTTGTMKMTGTGLIPDFLELTFYRERGKQATMKMSDKNDLRHYT